MGFKWFPYLVGHYLWLVAASLPLVLSVEFLWTRSTGVIRSREKAFAPVKVPSWFLHATDIHIGKYSEGSYNRSVTRMRKAVSVFKPRRVVFTGDNVDGYWPNTLTAFRRQNPEDWALFEEFLGELSLSPVQVAGNHDIYGVLSPESKENYANGIVFNESNRVVGRTPFDEYEFVTINPYVFPSPSLSLIWYLMAGSKEKKAIEAAVEGTERDGSVILVGHHPARMWFNWLCGFLSKTNKVRMYLSGHLHPHTPKFMHHGNVLEVVGTALKKNNEVGLVTIDNDEFVYHQMDLSKEKYGVLTFPVPDQQKTGHSSFTEVLELRALAFGENVTLLADGGPKIKGRFNCSQKIEDGVHLCVLKLDSVLSGTYSVKLTGDWDGTVTFTVGNTAGPIKEKLYKNEPTWVWILLLIMAVFGGIQLTIPYDYGSEKARSFDMWISGSASDPCWITAIFGGMMIVHHRVSQAPMFLRIALFAAFLWVLLLPSVLFRIEDKISMFWTWGFVCGGKAQYHYLGAKSAFFFISGVLVPCCVLTSSISMIASTHWGSLVFIGDFLFYAGTFYGFYVNLDLCTYYFGAMGLYSFLGLIIPVLLHGCVLTYLSLTIWRILTHKNIDNDYSFIPSKSEAETLLPQTYVS